MTISTVIESDNLNTYRTTLNTVVSRFNNLGTFDAINIDGGNIDGTNIGDSDPANGTFVTLTISDTLDASTATLILATDSISGDAINGGTASVENIVITAAPSSNTHGTNKQYVDDAVQAVDASIIALSVFFGG